MNKLLLMMATFVVTINIHGADANLPAPRPVPRMQAVPLPQDQISFQRDGVELARYYHATNQFRPFVYPVIGPSGRSLTRMGHPHDPQSHKHHNSVWISHQSVNGVNFWEDGPAGRIVHQRIEKLEDGQDEAFAVVYNAWQTTNKILLYERRQITVRTLPREEWVLILDINLESPKNEPVTLGETAFGIIGVRMARSIGVTDGGGQIRNSEGDVNEAAVFRKPAKWVDYSGNILTGVLEGITLMDHPANFNHPAPFHVRNDGWMGACLTFQGARRIEPGNHLALRYGLYVHSGRPPLAQIQELYDNFVKWPVPDLRKPQK